MSRAKHARRTPTLALAMVGVAILAGMAFVMPDVLATEGPEHNSGSQHTLAVTKLPELGEAPTYVKAINDHGVAVGYADFGKGSSRAVIWENGKVRELENLPDSYSSKALDINIHGEIVGIAFSEHDQENHAVLWEPTGEIRDLGSVEGIENSAATAINNARQIVGASSDRLLVLSDPTSQAFLWEDGEMRKLDLPGKGAVATDIANTGDIVGSYRGEDDVDRAFLLRDGEVTTFSNSESRANAVNDDGHVAGELEWRYNAPDEVPTFWRDGNPKLAKDLRSPQDTDGQVTGMNERSDLVGHVSFGTDHGSSTQAVLWKSLSNGGHGYTFLDPVQGHDSTTAADINNHGVIVGNSTGGEGTDPVIWR